MQISDMLLVSDIDGTLLPDGKEISEKNRKAVERFRAAGGSFTLASGRSPVMIQPYADFLGVSLPVIANNGAVIFDLQAGRCLWSQYFPENFRDVLTDIRRCYPSFGIVALTDTDEYYLLQRNVFVNALAERQCWNIIDSDTDSLPDSICKALFLLDGDPTENQPLIDGILASGYPGMELVCCGDNAFEMMAAGVTKGSALKRLAELCGKTMCGVVAIGDHNNDIDSIRRAALGVAVANALEATKNAAGLIVSSCEEDGVAELIDYLIANHDIVI